MSDRVKFFDTTLRDGEQSPGFSLTSPQKLEMAKQLARLNVDVIEAGFPAASPDDFAGRADHRARGARTDHRRPGASRGGRYRSVLGGDSRRRAAAHPHLPVVLGHSSRIAVSTPARRSQGARGGDGVAGEALHRRRRVLADGRHALRLAVRVRGARGGDRGRRDDGQHRRHVRLCPARRVRHDDHLHPRARRQYRARDDLGALPRRPGPGGRQLAGRHQGRRAAGRVLRQWHRRAGRQRGARRAGHGADGSPRPPSGRAQHQHRADRADQSSCCSSSRASPFSPTRRSSAPTPLRTRAASTRTACSRTPAPTRS